MTEKEKDKKIRELEAIVKKLQNELKDHISDYYRHKYVPSNSGPL